MTTPRVTVPVDMKCSKCGARSGDDWEQCFGSCPMPGSPHYSAAPAPEGGAVKGPGDYTMCIAEPQTFERFPALASHIERMAVGRSVGSLIEWDAFLRELNAALAAREDAQPVAWTDQENMDVLQRGRGAATMWPTDHGKTTPFALYTHSAPDALQAEQKGGAA